ncbi:MAG: hypothetical protein AMS24_00765 [Chlamydiae bacterium SM23_39]|nr:MAG: hypothetical protein AMS24_00765 [Chlamydiae bacterium SM23_39]
MKNYVIPLILSLLFLMPLNIYSHNTASEISSTFTRISENATPSVVFIKAQNLNDESLDNYENPFNFFSDEFFRHFFGHPKRDIPSQPKISGGSGFIVSSDGYILTNYHVIKDASEITVIMNNKEEYKAKIIGSDSRTDLAIIKIDNKNLPYLNFGNSDDLKVGEWVMAIGNPFALRSTVTVGVVSAKGRQNLRIADLEDFIQTDAAINPGNSGGPLLNLKGEVVGVNTAIVSRSGGYMGIGFAIPSNMTKNVVDQIIQNGAVKRGYVGILLQEVDQDIAEAFNLKKSKGILISEVAKDSPAEKGGLKQGDIILEYNNNLVKDINSFRNEIALLKPNTIVDFKILRKGEYNNIKIKLGVYPNQEPVSQQSSKLGIEVTDVKDIPLSALDKWNIPKNANGVIITSVKRGSLAERGGLKMGMLIVQADHKDIKSVEDFTKILKNMEKKKHLLFLIKYHNVTRFISIKLS